MNRRKFTRLIGFGSAAVAIVSNMPAAMASIMNDLGTATTVDEEDLLNGFINLLKSAKPWTYYMWLNGNVSRELNRYYFHRTIAQPQPENKPGMTWPNVGINFDTSQTWWEPGSAWIAYISRCQYLLQQGRFVADAAILTDEGAPSSAIRQLNYDKEDRDDLGAITETILRRYHMLPFLPPAGYDYDYINPGTLYDMQVKNGKITLSHGMSYKVLVLPPGERMTLRLAKKVKDLVMAGATVIGMKPEKSPTLNDFAKGDAELRAISEELWGNGTNESTGKQVGKGWVFSGNATQKALNALKVLPDFECAVAGSSKNLKLKIDYIHRQTETADIYFISNQQQETADLNCLFRVTGRQPEFWLPDTGKVISCQAFEQQESRTKIPIRLDPSGSLFVVFHKTISKTKKGTAENNFSDARVIQTIDGPWAVQFDPKWGGPEEYQMDKLHSWTTNNDPGIKYYSGTATYKKQITISEESLNAGKTLCLDLGLVKELARVKWNGKDLGVLWKPPFRIEIGSVVQTGNNTLEIEITNLWPNRLIADSGLPKEKQLTKSNWNPYKPDSPLLESGLIGPVTLHY